ncbi:helix-turn-helix domain-containing protein [Crassaminicella profunda]|uniref:helix-turn-helix domain-containing protein n=1 Tax=Crassaminicella profunda TaxID=1286698 RepID=UPI001CA6CFF3|nr:helix-turn-helix transcriptional regulator [Crassaminicella profunda]QZY56737.1 helix-turn-helix domain-containing protein [Crassaminicella profunda]
MNPHNGHKDKGAEAKCKTLTFEMNINSEDFDSLPEKTLGQRVHKLRKQAGYNIKELGDLVNMAPASISYIENEKKVPFISTLKKLCDPLQTTLNYLLQIDSWPEDTSGEIIKKYRLLKGLSQRELAKLCNLNQSTIKDYEANRIKGFNNKTLGKIYKSIGYTSV